MGAAAGAAAPSASALHAGVAHGDVVQGGVEHGGGAPLSSSEGAAYGRSGAATAATAAPPVATASAAEVRLIDFGLARQLPVGRLAMAERLDFLAPAR